MEAADNVVSKVLIIDDGNAETLDQIKMFCAENDLIGVKTHSDNVMAVLKSNVDLGACCCQRAITIRPPAASTWV